jgi:hypothetical protein
VVKPYTDTFAWQTSSKKIFVRVFDDSTDPESLEWHTDQFARMIQVITGNNWQLQFDNELPQDLKQGSIHWIEPSIHHRILKGNGELVLLIIENTIR